MIYHDPAAPWQCPKGDPIPHPRRVSRDLYSVLVVIPTLPSRPPFLERARTSVFQAIDTLPPTAATYLHVESALDTNAATPVITPAAVTRNRAVAKFLDSLPPNHPAPRWVAFLDDDDEFLPNHLRSCIDVAINPNPNPNPNPTLVYPWFEVATPPSLTTAFDSLPFYPINPPALGMNFTDPQVPNLNPCPLYAHAPPASPYTVPFSQELAHTLQYHNNFIPVTALIPLQVFAAVGGFPVPGTPQWPYQDCEDWGLWLRLLPYLDFKHNPDRTWRWWLHGTNTTGNVNRP